MAAVCLLGQVEGGVSTKQQEEEQVKKVELQEWQQPRETQLDLPAGPAPIWVSQVGAGSLGWWDAFTGLDRATVTGICHSQSRLKEPRPRPMSLTSPSLKSLFPSTR